MTTTRQEQSTTTTLYVAFELSERSWKLAFSSGHGEPPRRRDVPARSLARLEDEISRAKRRFGLPDDALVCSCYEAGRDGFWIHRYLEHLGIQNQVIDSSSIEVNRRQRRAKSDRLDAERLLAMLLRWHGGEQYVWSVVVPPSEANEDERRLHRELNVLRREQTAHINRIKSLLTTLGLSVTTITRQFPADLQQLRQWNEQPLPRAMHQQLLREFERMQLANDQIRLLERERAEYIRGTQAKPAAKKKAAAVEVPDRQLELVRRLLQIRGIGTNSAWLFVKELFGWRKIRNRRQLASLVGLTPTPYASGDSQREQGISKAGNKHLRSMLVEIAWGWLRFQPESQLTKWYAERFATGSKRQRRIGIVALARKLLIVLWKYLKEGDISDGFHRNEGPPNIAYTVPLR